MYLNTTTKYHQQDIKTLGWELTICNTLADPESPCRKFLKNTDSYGNLLFHYLNRFIPMSKIRHVIEVGGGYGFLMRDLFGNKPDIDVSMLDISPFLIQKQRECLKNDDIDYVLQDVLEVEPSFLRQFDMALFNENLGDFPTAVHVSADIFKVGTDEMSPPLRRIKEIYDRYNLKLPDGEWFNFNIGAIDVLEKLCLATIPYIFLSEHSCEASTPQDISKHLHIEPSGNPERITLQGHDEYTIKFSHLSDVASNNGYNVIRGRMADYIEPDFSDRVMAALRSTISANDEYEIIRQFIYDLYKYEYLILIRKEGTR